MAPIMLTNNNNIALYPATGEILTRWTNPNDVFSVLLILGGDIIARALVQLANRKLTLVTFSFVLPGNIFSILLILDDDIITRTIIHFTGIWLIPVTFSFGWVVYSVSVLVSAVGENRLLPTDPNCKSRVINGKSGYIRNNTSWILNRVVRDFDHWSDPVTKKKTAEVLDKKLEELRKDDPKASKPTAAGLVVTIYRASMEKTAKEPKRDPVYWSRVATAIVQLGVAAILCELFGDWDILFLIVWCIALVFVIGALS